MTRRARLRAVGVLLSALALLTGCASSVPTQRSERAAIAKTMFEERCKKAGVFIHRTVKDVEGILVMKLRPESINYGDQYRLDDPYGSDLLKDGYLVSFLHGSWEANAKGELSPGSLQRVGYQFVEAIDPVDGKRYHYTGSVRDYVVQPTPPFSSAKEPFVARGFVMDKAPAPSLAPRYGVTYDDISTRHERDHWIAGSSLRVVDTHTGEVLAERIGYMWDVAQGSNAGGRSPWLFATDNACPAFEEPDNHTLYRRGSVKQLYQTLKFVSRV